MIIRTLRRFPHAIRGFCYALTNDFSFRTQFYGGGVVVGLLLWLLPTITSVELLFLFLGWSLLLITELQNSATEAALDKLHPELHPAIKQSKDMAASAVLVAGILFALIITILIIS